MVEAKEKDFTKYADKPVSPTMEAFHEWLQDVTGLKLDARSVALGGTLRNDFQKATAGQRGPGRPAKPAAKPAAPKRGVMGKAAPAKGKAAPPAKRGRPASGKRGAASEAPY
jgi:hypothetical protein